MTEVLKKENEIVEFNPFNAKMIEFKERYENIAYDLTDPDQEKSARSDRLSVGKVISRLDAVHKELKAPLKERTDLIDSRRKEIKDELLAVQQKIKDQIAEHERKIQEHAEMLQEKVDFIEGLSKFDPNGVVTSGDILKRLDIINNIDVNDEYEHRKADATLAKVDAISALEDHLERVTKYEAEQAELERLRKEQAERERADREKKIADDAREQAEKKAAEEKANLEREKKAAEEKAKQDLIDAENRRIAEKEKAEREKQEAIEAERIAAENREKARIAAEEKAKRDEIAAQEKREANKKHNAKINNEAKAGFIEGGMSDKQATLAVTLIAKKSIKHVTITY